MKSSKKAFTLFELMVVVMIIGIVYSLVLGRFNPKDKVAITTLPTLKSALQNRWQEGERLDLYLYDHCKKSVLFKNFTPLEKVSINLKPTMFEGVKVYKSDSFGHARLIKFSPIAIEKRLEPICFHFTLFPNGSSSNYIVEKDNNFYIFYPYFEDVNITGTLEEALDLYTHKKEKKIESYE